jgi:3-isopropylmalate/(R)-2-methylmalate dehydratase large subunit
MGAEISADFAIFEADDAILEHVRERNKAPFEPQYPDSDAVYRERRTIALDQMEPLVALPDQVVRNSVPVGQVAGEKIDQAFIGSCANGTLDDFAIAARVLQGQRVAPTVRLIVTPGSQEVYRNALRAGYVQIIADAGAVITNPTCGACGGAHLGILGPGETCITASTRNFKGRMGDATARIYMASPATVAASAIKGAIAHPGEYTSESFA